MKILTEEELAAKLDFRRPLTPPPEEPRTPWCIPFEHGANGRGTRITISKARQIAAELRAEIAEAEKREIFDAFKKEEERSKELGRQYTEMADKWADAQQEAFDWKRKANAKRKRPGLAKTKG